MTSAREARDRDAARLSACDARRQTRCTRLQIQAAIEDCCGLYLQPCTSRKPPSAANRAASSVRLRDSVPPCESVTSVNLQAEAEEIDSIEQQIRALIDQGKTLVEARRQLWYHQLQSRRGS